MMFNNLTTEKTYADLDTANVADGHYRRKWQRRKAIHLENGDAVVYLFHIDNAGDAFIERQNGTNRYYFVTPASMKRLMRVCDERGQNIDLTPAWFVPTGVR